MKTRALRISIQIACAVLVILVFRGVLQNETLVRALNSTSLLAAASRLAWLEWTPWLAATASLLLLTWVFGRLYCSYFCPLGLVQDLAGRFARLAKFRRPIRSGRSAARLRPFFFFLGFGLIVFRQPVYQYLDHYAWFGKMVLLTSAGAAGLALLVGVALVYPRWFCVAVCPAGTVFSLLHRRARLRLEKPLRSEGVCGGCQVCRRECPTSCIREDGSVDRARCIQCLECLSFCPRQGFRPEFRLWHKTKPRVQDASRLEFLKAGVSVAAAVAVVKPLGTHARKLLFPVFGSSIMPPGAGAWESFHSRCVGCGLCVSSCPSRVIVLRDGYPHLDYGKSFCGYDCKACLPVCPSGAISDHSLERKKRIRIGTAKLAGELCVVYRDKKECGACAEHCPTGAITSKMWGPGILAPVFDESKCIGCGACEHICPAEPVKAFTVSPVSVQSFAAEPGGSSKRVRTEGKKGADFPF